MEKNNVYSTARVVKEEDGVQDYELGTFVSSGELNQSEQMMQVAKLDEKQVKINADDILGQIQGLSQNIGNLQQQITTIQNNGMVGRDIDKQVVEAIKDLKHYASFFEQATFQMESKILKTSMSIAQKIINIEISANSAQIAKETIAAILAKIKTASKVKVHLNPKDYQILKNDLNLEPFIELMEDANVTPGGVVIASDLGNFDGNVEAKVSSMLESLDSVI
jgi:flagellar assembly protein FliH